MAEDRARVGERLAGAVVSVGSAGAVVSRGPLGLTLARHCAMGVMAVGYSGHGVARQPGQARATDLYEGNHEPWRGHAFYMKRPGGIPPEPMRWIGYQAYTRFTGRSPFKRMS